MKLKNTILASTLLSLLAANAFAAKELTPEQAAALKPFERINISSRFNAIGDATDAVPKELPKAEAYRLEPFDTISVSGFSSSQPDVNEAIAQRSRGAGYL